jgi:hypothetical protein
MISLYARVGNMRSPVRMWPSQPLYMARHVIWELATENDKHMLLLRTPIRIVCKYKGRQ